MADEVDRGQADGEVAGKGGDPNARSSGIATLAEIGISSQRLSEWRELRDAGPEAVETADSYPTRTRCAQFGRQPVRSTAATGASFLLSDFAACSTQ